MQTTDVRQSSGDRSQLNSPHTVSAPVRAKEPAAEPALRSRSSLFKTRPNGQASGDRGLIEALVSSKVFQEYERAFTDATGLPVALRPVETWQLPHHGKRNEGPFCSLISQKSRACASCLSVQEELSDLATSE